jgi:hypothetical protein
MNEKIKDRSKNGKNLPWMSRILQAWFASYQENVDSPSLSTWQRTTHLRFTHI